MAYSLVWLAQVLERAGLKVAPVPGWEQRGRGDVAQTLGVLCHHTAGPRDGNMPSLKLLIEGRADLPGPLAQLGLGRDGTYYVIAAGRCNHAGAGIWNGITSGNAHFIGVEAENTGTADDRWPEIQVDAYQRGVAALLKHAGLGPISCAGHKEYAQPAGRKPDPTLDMAEFRTAVARHLDGTAPPPALIPAAEPPSPMGSPGRPTLRRGARGEWVKLLREQLGTPSGAAFDAPTEAAVRAFQRAHQLVPDGIVGPKTWARLGPLQLRAPPLQAAASG
jgi:hypothetical protein